MPGAFFSRQNLLFDLDGTLVDSSPAHARAYIQALTPDHPELASAFFYGAQAGRSTREVLVALGVPESNLAEVTREKQRCYRGALDRGEVQLFPGVFELLQGLTQMNRRLFLVTGASRISAERILGDQGLRPFFSGIISADDVSAGKPSPAPYLKTLAEFKLNPDDCLVIEDGPNGVASAQAAGLPVLLLHTRVEIPGVPRVENAAELLRLIAA